MVAGPDAITREALERELALARAERDRALAQQTALAEVLRTINASSADFRPVFDLIIRKAMALCDAAFGALLSYENDRLSMMTQVDGPPRLIDFWQTPQPVHPNSTTARALAAGKPAQIVDLARSDAYLEQRLPMTVAGVELGGIRTILQVPLMSETGPIGVFVLYRQEVRPFTDAQITLVEAFAGHAALAMGNARLLTGQREALEQQTATTEVLEVINASPGSLELVLGAMLDKAMHLCEAAFGIFGRFDGQLFEPVVDRGVPAALMETTRQIQSPPPNSGLGRLAAGESVVQLVDLANTDVYRAGFVGATALVDIGGAKTAIFVALRKDDRLVGVIVMYRREVRAFSDKQAALLQNFAAQAVVAMENARLLTEQREALEQQTATADILRVISQSPTDIAPVMVAVARAAVRFCGAEDAHVFLRDGDEMVSSAHEGPLSAHRPGYRDALDASNTARAETILEARITHLPDTLAPGAEAAYRSIRENSTQHGFRAQLNAPMLKDGRAIGCICLRRRDPGAFTSRQIALLETFAAQAVIAIENVRLFTELRETLEQQTATADILRVIAQSPTDVTPVLDAVAKAALRFCGAEDVAIDLREGEIWRCVAHAGVLKSPIGMTNVVGRRDLPGRAMLSRAVVQIPDIETATGPETEFDRDVGRQVGFRAAVAAPMLRQDQAVGAIILHRRTPGSFSERQIALLQSFAAQAVIALENTRLFTELREALEQQTATSEILGVISQSPTDVSPVLDAVAKAALRFCGAEDSVVLLREGDQWVLAGHEGPMSAEIGSRQPLNRQTAPGRAILDTRTAHFPDVLVLDPVEYAAAHDFSRLHGFRAALAAPMLLEGQAIGAVALRRSEPGAFTERQIEVLQSFAAQAVIALENTRLFTELRESLDYQTATSEVLEVISRSTSDLTPVLDKMLAAATHLCGVEKGDVSIRRDGQMRYAASIGTSAAEDAWLRSRIIAPDRSTCAGRAMVTRQVVHVLDQSADAELAVPRQISAHQTVLSVPLVREGEAIGVITVLRDHVEAFTDRQIALIKTFADQAVIAIENARLLGELRERTDDLTESLEYQTATSDLLEVISRSTSDVQPVLDRMLSSAARLCGVAKGDVAIRRGEVFRHVAFIGAATPEEDAWLRSRITVPGRGTSTARALLEKQVDHVLDQSRDPERVAPAGATAARTTLAVPLLREGEPIGVISLLRDHVEPFTERQIALVKTFADQAVIAMENARLLSELRESLDQQIATAEILQVINTSPGNLTPVFRAILEKAHSTCGADMGSLFTWDGTHVRAVVTLGYDPDIDEILREPHGPIGPMVALMAGQRVFHRVHEQDGASEGPHEFGPHFLAGSRIRTNLIIPLRKDDTVLGFISANRREVRPYNDKEIALLESFASQAVIAMENARLLGELRERQNELRVTFDNMGDAVVMFDADQRLAAWNRNFQEMLDVPDSFLAGRPTLDDYVRLLIGRGELGDQADVDSEMARFHARFVEQWSAERTRPDGRILEVRNNPVPGGGAVLIYSDITERKKAEAAIRSARDAAEAALLQLKAAQANLVQSEKMASLGQLTAGIAHEIKNPLNFVNNFATLSVDLLDELKEIAGPALDTLDADRRAELDETMGLLTGNLGKIAEHGKRADGIVRSMLSHSRGGSGDWQASDINALVEEALNLAYHGARAQDKEFNVTLERDLETAGRPIELVPQDVTRVFLNLFGNGFYAANKRRLAREPGFRPTLKVSTRDLGDGVEVRVRDNGIGIAPEVREKLFQPFFTTKPTGEGTGLGLSISYDIVTQQHGGAIEVESEVGNFTEFTVRLPRIARVASAKRA